MYSWSDVLDRHRGVILCRDEPAMGSALERAVRAGVLARVLPGTYVDARAAEDPLTLIAAGVRRFPGAVVTEHAAAALTFWPELRIRRVTIAGVQARIRSSRIHFSRRLVPPEWHLVLNGITLTAPALTAMDLAVESGGDSIDCVLRTRRSSLPDLARALSASAGRAGNHQRARLLLDSRDEAWSRAERIAHAILRGARITGWVANHPVVSGGENYVLDIAFIRLRVAVEVDGKKFHGHTRFDQDRYRQNNLVADGWIVVRLTWTMLTTDVDTVVRVVRGAIAQGEHRRRVNR